MLRPAPIWPTIIPTVTRKPRMHGLPPMTAGFCVMRVKSFMAKLILCPCARLYYGCHAAGLKIAPASKPGRQAVERDQFLHRHARPHQSPFAFAHKHFGDQGAGVIGAGL